MQTTIRNGELVLTGYVNAVERESKVLRRTKFGDFVEKVTAGAFGRALNRAKDVRLRLNHGRDLGGTAGGNLTLKEDAIGLYAEARTRDPEMLDIARRGGFTGWSFTFRPLPDGTEWEERGDKPKLRKLNDFELLEVSPLTVPPAYLATSLRVETREQGGEDDRLEIRSCEDESAPAKQEAPAHVEQGRKNRLKRLKLEV